MSTEYADDLFSGIRPDGMTEDLWKLVHDDTQLMHSLGVGSDRERNLLFYLDNFVPDLLGEFGVRDADKDVIVRRAMEILRDKKNVNLNDIWMAVGLAVRHHPVKTAKKVAYPNTMGVYSTNEKPKRDIERWIRILSAAHAAKERGEDMDAVLASLTEDWDKMEKQDFSAWARYYEHKDHEKYAAAADAVHDFANVSQAPQVPEAEQELMRGRPGRPGRRRTPRENHQALISRLDSAAKLLREFSNVWPIDVWRRLSEALADLQREIVPLKTASTTVDCIVKTANIWERHGFAEGADFLRSIAQEEDVTTQIEKALTGKEFESGPQEDKTSAESEVPEMPPGGEVAMPAEMSPMPPDASLPSMPPAGAEESLPTPVAETTAPMPPAEPEVQTEVGGEPFANKSVRDVLDVLEPLLRELSERAFVRALSKADMMLDGMNIASHFPELGEAQAKALELNIYVGTRLEKVVSKLKGGLKDGKEGEKKEKELPPAVEMGEIGAAAPTGPEQAMFEVTEGEPAPPAATLPAVART